MAHDPSASGYGAPAPPGHDPAAGGGQPQVDVQKLADKVYRLLLAEAHLGRARVDSPVVARRPAED